MSMKNAKNSIKFCVKIYIALYYYGLTWHAFKKVLDLLESFDVFQFRGNTVYGMEKID